MHAARDIAAQLDPDAVLDALLHAARRLTGAREAHVERVADDDGRVRVERSPMGTILRTPVRVHGAPRATLLLTGPDDGGFDVGDEEIAGTLAEWAGVALGNAERYAASERRRRTLEDAASALEGTTDIAHAITDAADLGAVLELTADRARDLVGAALVLVSLVEGRDLVLAAASGDRRDLPIGSRRPLAGTTAEAALAHARPVRLDAGDPRLRPLRDALSSPETIARSSSPSSAGAAGSACSPPSTSTAAGRSPRRTGGSSSPSQRAPRSRSRPRAAPPTNGSAPSSAPRSASAPAGRASSTTTRCRLSPSSGSSSPSSSA